jgi:hypothetical protein
VSQSTIAYDASALTSQVKLWIEMVMQYAPEPYKSSLSGLVNELST